MQSNNTIPIRLRKQLFIYSEIILKSRYSTGVKNGGNGARLYFLAKDWDLSKRGCLLEDLFRSYIVDDLGISDWNYRRWLNSAVELGLISKVTTSRDKRLLILTAYSEACRLLEIDRLKPMQAITIKDLIGKNWQSKLWACFLANYQGNPISRETLFDLSGVKQSTQRNLEKRNSKIRNHHNYAKDTSLTKDQLSGYREFVNKSAFLHRGQITFRLPDTKEIKGAITKKYNSTLKHINKQIRSSRFVAGQTARIYCKDDRQLKQAERTRDRKYPLLFLESEHKNFYHAINYALA